MQEGCPSTIGRGTSFLQQSPMAAHKWISGHRRSFASVRGRAQTDHPPDRRCPDRGNDSANTIKSRSEPYGSLLKLCGKSTKDFFIAYRLKTGGLSMETSYADIIQKIQAGDETAFSTVYEQTKRPYCQAVPAQSGIFANLYARLCFSIKMCYI